MTHKEAILLWDCAVINCLDLNIAAREYLSITNNKEIRHKQMAQFLKDWAKALNKPRLGVGDD